MTRATLGSMQSGLVGRDVEAARVDAVVEGLPEGGAALVVSGEAGVGKSALLHYARARADALGRRTLGGYADHVALEAEPIATYRPARIIPLGEHAAAQMRRETSLDALVTPPAPPFFIWHTAEDAYVPPEHTYRLARALAANEVAHTVHVFAHGPHSLGLARGAGDAEVWTKLAASWIAERAGAHREIRSTRSTP